ncbi:hypothetical protein [Chryseobacterium viscerum]|uniref:Uncharacterized protein n=1 Tax=Chryseobacterium viscerum TaxID=1037377 RepID=A0A5N4BVP1_9FLAO|nr:hypothetical protein [Chryseobacterium viscerum]KAB1232513.1 hypothetical protein F8D52_01750 [Chryseobacterium viscerum]
MKKKLTPSESNDIKEITLYNFATIRDPEYVSKEDLKSNIHFICFDKKLASDSKNSIQDFDKKSFLDFEKLNIKNAKNNKIYDQIILNKFFDRILYLYKSKSDNFYEINKLLIGEDHGDENNIKLSSDQERELQLKIWLSFVYNLKYGTDFKQKEIATNLLRYFHLKKHRNLIDDENKEERFQNLDQLINAQIVIPEDLFPKSETFFYGEKNKLKDENLEHTAKQHTLNVLYLRKKIFEDLNEEISPLLDNDINRLKKEIEIYEKNNYDFKDSQSNRYFASIEFIREKAYFLLTSTVLNDNSRKDEIEEALLTIDYWEINKGQKVTKYKKINFSRESFINHSVFSAFDAFFDLFQTDTEHNLISQPASAAEAEKKYQFSIEITFRSEEERTINNKLVWQHKEFLRYEARGYCNEKDSYGKAFKPSGYGIQMLGIADYRRVVSTISRYIPAEVAHIENLMASEFREKVTTKETTTEITEFESSETETEKLNETSTNDRFQMQNEVARILNDQRTNNVNSNVSVGGQGYSATLSTGNSATNSKEESNKQAVTEAQEITNKAVEKIVSKVKREKTTKITEKFIDVNKYGFDNRGNKEHVSGVYRHINAVYRNRIHNYGRRLMIEFSIPEPALIHKLATRIDDTKLYDELKKYKAPNDPSKMLKSIDDINESNYLNFSIAFDITLDAPPTTFQYIMPKQQSGKAFYCGPRKQLSVDFTNPNNSNYLPINDLIPKNYKLQDYILSSFSLGSGLLEFNTDFGVIILPGGVGFLKLAIGNLEYLIETYTGDGSRHTIPPRKIDKYNILPDNNGYKFYLSGRKIDECWIDSVDIEFKPKEEAIYRWRKKCFDEIYADYDKKNKQYEIDVKAVIQKYKDEVINSIKIENEKYNQQDSHFREIEINTLKRNCLSYLIDEQSKENVIRKFGTNLIRNRNSFESVYVEKAHDLDEYTAFVRFLEQAFEWENMSYTFYPYYWGDEKSWKENYNEESGNVLHKAFLQAGMARVIVTVRPKFENAVNMYMTTGKIWMGGNLPVYGSALFVSIANELKSDEKYIVEDEWESVLPTGLIALQSSGVAINQSGLPNLDYQGDLGQIQDNSAKLPTKRNKFLGLF